MQNAMNQPKTPTVAYRKDYSQNWWSCRNRWQVMSDGTMGNMVDTYKDFGARDSVMKMFENTGLGNRVYELINGSIDKVYEENVMPTDARFLTVSTIAMHTRLDLLQMKPLQEAYERWQGSPGDRLLTPKEYIEAEASYRNYSER
jgi:hypothetical protein